MKPKTPWNVSVQKKSLKRVLYLNAGRNYFGKVYSKAASFAGCSFLFVETGFVCAL